MSDITTPDNGWWPEDSPVTQMLFKDKKQIANVIKQTIGWRPFSLIELNASKTSGKPLSDSVATKEEAKIIAEKYADDK